MKKTKKRLISYLLGLSLMLNCIPFNAFASEKLTSETYVSKELGLILERVVENDRVIAYTKSLDGKIIHTAMEYNGQIILDGEVIADVNPIINNELEGNKIKGSQLTNSSTWGPWSTNTVATIDTGGLTTAAIATLLALYAGFTPFGIIFALAGVIAGKYDEVTIKVSIRYREDDEFIYYQRYTYFYGDGVLITGAGIENPFYDTGKSSL